MIKWLGLEWFAGLLALAPLYSEYGDTCRTGVLGGGVFWKGSSPLFGSSGSSLVADALLSLRPCLGLSADVSELAEARLSSVEGMDLEIGVIGVE
jgi:hypothetical protein